MWQEAPGKDRPVPILQCHTHDLSVGRKTQATAKLQIYWSGNKYKYLIKKLLWKDLSTTVSCLDSATPALTPDLSTQCQGEHPRGSVAGQLSHYPSSSWEGLTTRVTLLPTLKVSKTTRSQQLIHNVPFTLIKLPIRSMVSQNEKSKGSSIGTWQQGWHCPQMSVVPPHSEKGG